MTDKRDDTGDNGPPSTARPPFDPTKFARESEARIRAASEVPPSNLPTVRPPPGFPLSPARVGSMPDLEELGTTRGARDALGADAIPFLAVAREDLSWFELEPEALKLLARIDGVASLEVACAKAGFTAEEGALLLLTLSEQGVVGFR